MPFDRPQPAGARPPAPGAPAPVRGCLVTGTDTGVGKTVVAAAIVARLRAQGRPVRALKPRITGLEQPPDPDWPADHELLARVSGQTADETMLHGYGPAVSPHLAIELAGAEPPSVVSLGAAIRAATPAGSVLVVEGVGGLLVPIGPAADVRDLAVTLGLPLIVAARPGLGTINHTLLTLEAARAVGLHVAGVVLTPWPQRPDVILRSNRETIEQRGAVAVVGLPPVAAARAQPLAQAGTALPLTRWLGI